MNFYSSPLSAGTVYERWGSRVAFEAEETYPLLLSRLEVSLLVNSPNTV